MVMPFVTCISLSERSDISSSVRMCFVTRSVLLLFQCFKVVPGLAFALFAVLDGLFGAIADARHAVGAVFAPDRLAVFQPDIVQRAPLHALAAFDTVSEDDVLMKIG